MGLFSLAAVACGSDGNTTNGAAGGSSGLGGIGTGDMPNAGGASGNSGSSNGGTADGGAGNAGSGNGGSGGAGNGGSSNGGSGNGGAANTGGATGTGGAPFTPTGNPITAPAGQWTYVEFPDTHCRDDSAAGIAVVLNSASTKLMIYLEGGGACFDGVTCLANPANVGAQQNAKTGGLFDRSNTANPVRDWNVVYVPYCTGDVHAGTNDAGNIGGPQHFVGRLNIEKFMNRVVPTFPNVTQVLLTGISAGGFGAAANADFVQYAFGTVPVTLIDDSGPPMSSQYVPACLQDKWRTTWGLDGSILKDCGADCPNHSDFTLDFAKHLAKRHPNTLGGLIETTGDNTITLFYGFGTNNCTGGLTTPVPAATFQAGLMDFRSQMQADGYSNFGTYFISGTQHTWLGGASVYTQTTGGVKLIDWVSNLIDGTSAANVGP